MANPKDQSASTEMQWTTVSEDQEDLTKVSFELIGDTFTGKYLGSKQQTDDARGGNYTQYRFMGADETQYFINPRYTLRQAMVKVHPGSAVRIQLTGYKDTGRDSQMQIFKVDTARLGPNAPIPGPAVNGEHMTTVPEDNNESAEPPF